VLDRLCQAKIGGGMNLSTSIRRIYLFRAKRKTFGKFDSRVQSVAWFDCQSASPCMSSRWRPVLTSHNVPPADEVGCAKMNFPNYFNCNSPQVLVYSQAAPAMAKDWDQYKREITTLYITEGKSLDDVQRIMKGRYRFDAS
jgi:hypothetical protein